MNVFSGMVHDKMETVIMLLDTMKSKILENMAISKTLKMRVFGSGSIKQIMALLKWKGEAKPEEEDKVAVKENVIRFIKTLLGSKRHGVIFHDPSVGQSEDANPLVKEVLRSLSCSRPWEDVDLSSIIVSLISACPDQMSTFLGESQIFL